MRRLAIRPGAIGDFILSLPALECLRTEYYEVWTTSQNAALVRFADRVQSIAGSGLDLLELGRADQRLIEKLRTYDSIVSWYGSNRRQFRDATRALGLPFTFFAALPQNEGAVHAADFYMDQALSLGVRRCEPVPRIPCQMQPGNYAVIHPFSGSAKKNWPLVKFESLARGLQRTMPVKWCAGREDPPLDDREVVRMEDLYELARWLAGARLYVGNDSGITHLAAAVGTPVLALFGPTNPAVWSPRGPHVRVASWGI